MASATKMHWFCDMGLYHADVSEKPMSLRTASWSLLEFSVAPLSQPPPPNDTSCDNVPEVWKALHRTLPTFIVAVCALGLLGNLFVLSVFLVPRRRLSVAEIYLANLAASDLVFILGLPFWAENIRNEFHWPFGAALCRVVNGMIKANMFISIFLVVAISQDRYQVLVHPVASRRRPRRRRARATCALIWALGAVLSVPSFLLRSVSAAPGLNVTACVLQLPDPAWHYVRLVQLSVLGFLLPLAALLFFNGHILSALWARREVPGAQGAGARGSKTTALILALVAAFLLCWAPYHFFALLDLLFQAGAVQGCFWEDFIDLGLLVANFFAFLNSCLNPVLYVFVGRLFRTKAWELYGQCTPRSLVSATSTHRESHQLTGWN
ncbi:B1 bradykinin receptor [Sorex fumeus]|uniref:B1 bradykinin receptor n=1 Tax=Sorex fumeus TaxID=62283 RepID=UPI0024AE000F|nr:B1 bradykinin receptor [Sorex fumeus]